jgi:hypothetical protein
MGKHIFRDYVEILCEYGCVIAFFGLYFLVHSRVAAFDLRSREDITLTNHFYGYIPWQEPLTGQCLWRKGACHCILFVFECITGRSSGPLLAFCHIPSSQRSPLIDNSSAAMSKAMKKNCANKLIYQKLIHARQHFTNCDVNKSIDVKQSKREEDESEERDDDDDEYETDNFSSSPDIVQIYPIKLK